MRDDGKDKVGLHMGSGPKPEINYKGITAMSLIFVLAVGVYGYRHWRLEPAPDEAKAASSSDSRATNAGVAVTP